MKKVLLALFLAFSIAANAANYYLAPNGSDASGNGSISSPWFTLNKAWTVAKAGDIIYLRGGEYIYTSQQTLSNKSGSAGNLIKIWAYPGEKPILKHTTSSGWFILMEKTNYVHFKGIEVSGENRIGSGLNWEMFNCNNNILETINYHHMIQGLFIKGQSDGNLVLNCDFHHNQDPNSSPPYENADGFGFTWSDAAGLTNTVRGCRFYWNCDDGMDMWANDNNIIIDNCWTFYNGYKPGTFTAVGTGGAGFKFGKTDIDHGSSVLINVKNCIAYRNFNWGFNQNECLAVIAIYNSAAYMNGDQAFYLNESSKAHILTNNIAYANGSIGYITSQSILTTNTFLRTANNSNFTVTDADFQSLTGDELLTARKDDGSLPDINFLKLLSSSDLIDKGTDVGIPYSGSKPDLGPFEYNLTQQPDIPVYNNSVVENATPTIVQMSYSLSLANIVPPVSAFNVQVNSVARTVSSVAIVGGKVQLNLASAVLFGDIVTVAYTKPATNPLQTAAGGLAESHSAAKSVTNNCVAPIPVYVSSVIENAAPSILEMTYSISLANIVPVTSAFYVLVNSVARTVNSVAIAGGKVRLTLSSPVVFGDIITVAYTKPASNPLQTASGGAAANIIGQTVTNNCAATIPKYVSSVVENSTPALLDMTYDLSLANIVPIASAFNVQVNSVTRTVSSVAIVGGKVRLTLASPVVYSDIITVAYTKPASNPLQTAAGGAVASFSAKSVTNNTASPIPVYISSVVEDDAPAIIEMSYDLSLANIVPAASAFNVQVNSVARTVSSVAIVGGMVQLTLSTAVAFGDIITVAYNKPASNPLQAVSGGVAASISAKSVTNNCIVPIPDYVSSVIENATPSILDMTFSISLANIVPVTSAFYVLVNSVARTVNSVAIAGGKVRLTLSSPVVFGDKVTFAYTKPASNPLQTVAGGAVANIIGQTVTNNCTATIPKYVSSVVENPTPALLDMTFDLSLANIVPVASAFNVRVNSVTRTVSSVAIVGGKVRLTLASTVVFGDIVTVAYSKPASNPLQTAAGGVAASISAKSVTNNTASPIPVYISSVVEDDAPVIIEMSYDLSLANIVPAASAFNVQVNSAARTVSSVEIIGSKVQLILATAVVFGDIVTVSYTRPAYNPLQTASGGVAASTAVESVTNNSAAPIPDYVSSVIENATPSILEMTYSISLANIVPVTSAFYVLVNSVARTVNSVAIAGGEVRLTLSSPVVFGDIITVAYTKPASNPLQTASGGAAANIIGQTVTNNCAATIPKYVSSIVENSTPALLDMTYDLSLANIVPIASAFNVRVNSVTRTVSSVAIVGGKVRLTLASPVVYSDIITVAYTKPASNPLQTAAGGAAASISAKSVTNNTASPIPVYISSVVEDDAPAIIEMSYDLSLANIVPAASAFNVQVNSVARTVSSVAIVGGMVQLTLSTAVAFGDIITVAYNKPASNPLQAVSGGVAASISAKSVTNNCIAPIPDYVSSVIENATPSIMDMTFSISLANIVPVTSAFYVLVNSVARTVNSVAIVGGKVRLTLSSPVVFGDIVTVAYTIPPSNPLQTGSGDKAASFNSQSVTNNCGVVIPNYISSVVENATPAIIEISFDLSLANIVPIASAFNVRVNSVTRSISSVAIVGGKVRLTLASPVVYNDIVTVAYSKPASNPLQTTAGAVAGNISTKSVTNNTAPIPVYVSSVIENDAPTIIEMSYDLSLANIAPATTAFYVLVNSVACTVESLTIVGKNVQLTLENAVVLGDVVTITYTKPVINPLQATSGGVAANIIGQKVTNNCVATIPKYISSVVENNTPTLLEMSYDLSLASIIPAASAFSVQVNSFDRTVSSVAIVGSVVQLTLSTPVVFGDIVTVAYMRPASNPLQAVSGGVAASIGAKSVTNNCDAPIPVYVSSVVGNATPTRIEMTYDKSLANIVPVASAFNVLVNSVTCTISSVAIVRGKVRLTLANPVVYNDIVTVAYSKPASNPLQTTAGAVAASISAKSVTNNCAAPIPVYVNSVVENETPTILEMTYNLSLADIVPAKTAFYVLVNSVACTIDSVNIAGGNVQLTLENAVVLGDVVTISYTKPDINPLQTTFGGVATNIIGQKVTNNCAATIPKYISSVVENDTPTLLVMSYDLSLASVIPAASAFIVQVNSVARTVSSVSIVGGKVQLTLSTAVVFDDIVTVAYNKPASNPLQAVSGGVAASISANSVTNNCDVPIPVYVSSVIGNATPTRIEMTYDIRLAYRVPAISAFNVQVNSVTRSISSVAIVGGKVRLTLSSAVVFGDIVTVAYSKPANNQLQTASGGIAESISSKSVTNNCAAPIPVYVSSVVENETPAILEMTYSLSLADIVPAKTAFYVLVNSVACTVDSVTIAGRNVQLTLENAVVLGDLVTITYTKPGINPLQTTSGGVATNIIGQKVTNNCAATIPKYVSSVVENATPALLDITYDLSLAGIIPAASAFSVQVNSIAITVNSVAIVGSNVQLTLSTAVVFGDIVTVAYMRPASNPLQTVSGGLAASISSKSVTNNCEAPNPVYVSSVVENATPALLDMIYDLSLTTIVPATSAFDVQVNSVSRIVSSVAIVGGKVLLTLATEVVFGDIVTVSYTEPESNPLQTVSGGMATNISGQSVTNNCQEKVKTNDSPILVVNNQANAYSGFVYELDASRSYDINNDTLIYRWILPDNVPTSSTSSSKIRFLAPIVKAPQNFGFQLSVTDGKDITSKTITINILPYKPEATITKIAKIEAKNCQLPDYPNNIADDKLITKWSVKGDNQWIIFTLAKLCKISHLEIAFLQEQRYESFFDIYASTDNLHWEPILINSASCDFSGNLQVFDFPASITETEYAYVKMVGHGNKLDSWNNFSEFKIFGLSERTLSPGSTDERKTIIYPNPAKSFFNISIVKLTVDPNLILITDLSGKVVFKQPFNSDVKKVQIPDNLKSDIYILELRSGKLILDAQKLIIKR